MTFIHITLGLALAIGAGLVLAYMVWFLMLWLLSLCAAVDEWRSQR